MVHNVGKGEADDVRLRRAALLPNDQVGIAHFKFRVFLGPDEPPPLQPHEHTQALDAEEIADLLRPGAGTERAAAPSEAPHIERLQRIEFRDPHHGWKLLGTVQIPWAGADHLDFSADGSYLMISTEYTGMLVKVDVIHMKLVGTVHVGGLPIDVKLSPDGTVFYDGGG